MGSGIDWTSGQWPQRDCDVTLRYDGPANEVVIAGDFTSWADSPLPLQRDGGGFSITLSEAQGLTPGQIHPYKLIVDGNWTLDPEERLRKYDGDCVNSGVRLPACEAGPEIYADPVEITWRDGVGDATVTLRPHLAADGVGLDTVILTLDGAAIEAEAVRVVGGEAIITLRDLPAGRHSVAVRGVDAEGRAAPALDLPFWIEAEPFDWRSATMYMVMIDRFANGDDSIDDPVGAPVAYPADWHGGDLWGVAEVIESGYFQDLGVDTLWLSPTNTQTSGHFQGRDDQRQYAAYHGYWPIEGRGVDPRFGGDEALHAVVAAAHAQGIRVLLDLINNQVHETHEYFQSNPEWFRTGCVCGVDPGCGWSERPLDCLFAGYLPDINWRQPQAEARFIDDALYWVDTFGVDGFRVDAVKHVETTSIYNLRAALTQRFEQGGTRVVMFGETAVGENDAYNDGCGVTYQNGYEWIDAYTGEHALDGQFDFPTHHRMQHGVLTGSLAYSDLERVIADAEARYDPEGVHVRFLGSHDKTRMASQAALDASAGCRWVEPGGVCGSLPATPVDASVFQRLRLAFTVLMTTPGIPLIYYGDEIAMPGGNDPDNRRDMIWGDALAELDMSDAGNLSALQRELRAWLAALGQARRAHPALSRGRRIPILATSTLYAFARQGDGPGEVAVVVLNRGPAQVDTPLILEGAASGLELGVAAFDPVVGEGQLQVGDGQLRLTLGAGQSSVFMGRGQ